MGSSAEIGKFLLGGHRSHKDVDFWVWKLQSCLALIIINYFWNKWWNMTMGDVVFTFGGGTIWGGASGGGAGFGTNT